MTASLQTARTPQDAADKREARRRRIVSLGLVVPHEGHPGLECTIRDISENGARIGFARNVPLPQRFWLMDVRARSVHGSELTWRNDLEAGLRFHDSIALGQIIDPERLFLKRLWLKHALR